MTLPVPTPPDLPLARTVAMPDHVGYPSGALALRFAELTVEADAQPQAVPVSDGDRTIVALPPLVVRARYAIDATPDEVATVDGGGDLSVLPGSATTPRSTADDDEDKHPEWLENARNQRMSLAQTENGRTLLNLYGLHEDVYADLFDESKSKFAKRVWSKGGGTTDMAADTHAALLDETGDQVVNDPSKTYHDHQGNPGSYNYNAFVRQFAAATYTLALDPDYDPSQGLPDQGRYYDASKATFDFADTVRGSTGNDKTTTEPMTRADVFDKVQEHPGGQAAAARPGHRGFDAVHNPFADDVWEGWDDDERELIREFHRMAVEDRLALRAAATPTTLFEGAGTARITGAAAVTDAAGAVRVELPAFELVLDDTTWSGAAADVARDRLNAAGFVADLVRDAVSERLRVAVVAADPTLLADPGR